MRDGHTQKISRTATTDRFEEFCGRFLAKAVVLSGPAAGQEIVLDRGRLTVGRGPGVDIAFDDPTMSRQHAAIEYAGERFRILDLGSTNGILLNEEPVQAAEMDHGDRFQIGSQRFQLVIEEREETPEVYELPSEA